jgi:hypothetical protein
MDNNFQTKISNPFGKIRNFSELSNIIDKGEFIPVIKVYGNKVDSYMMAPKSMKYLNGKFYIKCQVDNQVMWVVYGEFMKVGTSYYGAFVDKDNAVDSLRELREIA